MTTPDHFQAVPRLTPVQEAALPMLIKEQNGNLAQVARQLGVSREAIRQRVMRAGPPKPKPVKANLDAAETMADGEGPEVKASRGLLGTAASKAISRDDLDPRELVAVADGFTRLARTIAEAKKMAWTLIDARQVNVTQGGPSEAILDAAAERVVAEVLPILCPACRQAVEALEGPG